MDTPRQSMDQGISQMKYGSLENTEEEETESLAQTHQFHRGRVESRSRTPTQSQVDEYFSLRNTLNRCLVEFYRNGVPLLILAVIFITIAVTSILRILRDKK